MHSVEIEREREREREREYLHNAKPFLGLTSHINDVADETFKFLAELYCELRKMDGWVDR